MNGGEVLVGTLLAHAVDTVFFVPGGTFVTVLEALSRNRNAIRCVGTRLESSAVFAADAYAAIRRRPAAVIVSRAPGATNAAIGVHTAMQASRPLVLFVANIPRGLRQREAFQEVDHRQMFTPLAKAVFEVHSLDEVSPVTARAFDLSISGRPGPVVVVISKDILDGRLGDPPIVGPAARVAIGADPSAIDEAARLIEAAERPLLLAGEMVSFEGCHAHLIRLAERIGAPVMAAYRQQDVFPNRHPAYAGHLSLNRLPFQQRAFDEADLVINIGHRFDSVTTGDYTVPSREQPLIMVHPDPTVFSQWQARVAIGSHCTPAIDALLLALTHPPPASRLQWRDDLHEAQAAFAEPGKESAEGAVDMARVVATFAGRVSPDTVVVTDAGTFSRWIQRYYPWARAASALGPVSGAMGYGVPGALGAAVAAPERPVFAWVGDGAFLMTGHEVAVIVQERLPVKIVVCDNAAWGSILVHQQKRFPGWDFGTRLASPDFATLARGYGLPAFTVRETGEFPAALNEALQVAGPALIHLHLDPRDLVSFSDGSSH